MSLRFIFVVLFFLGLCLLQPTCNAQVVDKVKETTIQKVEEKAVEETEKISDAIFEKIEGLFKKKKKTEETEEEPAKKEENESPKTVKKSKYTKNS